MLLYHQQLKFNNYWIRLNRHRPRVIVLYFILLQQNRRPPHRTRWIRIFGNSAHVDVLADLSDYEHGCSTGQLAAAHLMAPVEATDRAEDLALVLQRALAVAIDCQILVAKDLAR